MKTIKFADICDIISKLDKDETENLNKYMALNPSDVQRRRDSMLIHSAYCEVLSAIHDAAKEG